MGRFYTDGDGDQPYELYVANLQRSIKSRNGQAFLRYLKRALLALPEPKLYEGLLYHRIGKAGALLEDDDGEKLDVPLAAIAEERACAIGAALRQRILDGRPVVTACYLDVTRRPGRRRALRREYATTLAGINTGDEYANDSGDEGVTHMVWAANTFGISEPLAWHIGYLNDERWEGMPPDERWQSMMDWIEAHLTPDGASA